MQYALSKSRIRWRIIDTIKRKRVSTSAEAQIFNVFGCFNYRNAAMFVPSCKSWRLGLKKFFPFWLLPKNTHPPIQPQRFTGLLGFSSGGFSHHKNQSRLVLSSCNFKNLQKIITISWEEKTKTVVIGYVIIYLCWIEWISCSKAGRERAASIINGPNETDPTSSHSSSELPLWRIIKA